MVHKYESRLLYKINQERFGRGASSEFDSRYKNQDGQ